MASMLAASPSSSASAPSESTMPTSVGSKQDQALPTIKFTNVQDLFDVINSTTSDVLAVTNVSPRQFAAIEREREERRRKFRFRRYDGERHSLLITIPTDVHEKLHTGIYLRFFRQLAERGQTDNWATVATATRRAQGHPGGSAGEGDSAGGPEPECGVKGAWPTLVVEAGVSESLAQLRNDMRWWFHASDHQVQIVVLAKFDATCRAIILEKWEEEPNTTRPGATTTRYAATLHPVLRQSITITQDTTTDPVSYNVSRGALVLEFRLLFLRDPGPGEGDFVLSVPELEDYARKVWNAV